MRSHLISVRLLLLAIVAICMTPAFLAAVYERNREQAVALSQAQMKLAHNVTVKLASLTQALRGTQRVLETAAHGLDRVRQSGACNAYLRSINEHIADLSSLGLADATGRVVCASLAARTGFSIGDRPYFQRAMATGKFSIGDYAVGRASSRPALMVALPLHRAGKVDGVLYALIELSAIRQRLAAFPTPEGITDALTDSTGVVLASSDARMAPVARALQDQELKAAALAAAAGEQRDFTQAGRLYSTRRIAAEGQGVVVLASVMSTDAALAAIRNRLLVTIAALMAVSLAVGALAWHLADRLVGQPIERVLDKLRSIEEGHATAAGSSPLRRWEVLELNRIEQSIERVADSLAARAAQRDAATAALAEGERRYRAQFEWSPQPMWVYDEESLDFLLVNDAAVLHYGYTREEFLRMTLLQIRPTEDIPQLANALRGLHTRPATASSARHITKDGRIIHVELAAHTMDWGSRRARMVVVYDVTARIEAAKAWERLAETLTTQVRLRTAELEAANQELEAFSYSVSHDLRSPLAAIRGFCNALSGRYGGLLPSEGAHYLERIVAGADQMNALIVDLLSLARVSREPLVLEQIEISRLAAEVVSRLNERFADRQVSVAIEQTLPVWGDARLVTIVLENLLGNAWKFTARATHAQVRIGRVSDAPNTIVVADNGVGFDSEYAGKLFQPFQRLHSAKEFEGTGIGLAIVARIMRRLGGRVWAESAEHEGARFYISFPEHGHIATPLRDIPPATAAVADR